MSDAPVSAGDHLKLVTCIAVTAEFEPDSTGRCGFAAFRVCNSSGQSVDGRESAASSLGAYRHSGLVEVRVW